MREINFLNQSAFSINQQPKEEYCKTTLLTTSFEIADFSVDYDP